MADINDREAAEIDRANASGRRPVVFIHGLWLLPQSWDPWRELFEDAGYTTIAPGWPDDPETMAEALAAPQAFAGKSIERIAGHLEDILGKLERPPALVGHSFGGLLTQIVAGRGLAAAAVAISPAPFRGVLPLPLSSLRAASAVLRNPRNRRRAVRLTIGQFRYSFANHLDPDEAAHLYETQSVPGPGLPLFQAAFANINPRTEARVDTRNPDRGPLLIIGGEQDHTVPLAISEASYKRQRRNSGVTEIVEVLDRGHSLTIDAGWRDVAEVALDFVRRQAAA